MKKKLLFLFAGISCAANAQNPIPNGNFETWNSFNYNDPQYYVQTSNLETFSREGTFNCIKTTDAYHGSFAAKLTTTTAGTDTSAAFFVNSSNTDGPPPTWHGGVPYTQMPTGIHGYYKSAIPAGDSAVIIVAFSSGGSNIGFYYHKLYGTHSTYIPFSFNFTPALSAAPDSVIFGATSSDVFDNIQIPGSMLQIDSIAFTGVTSQPAELNGDFELWQPHTINTLPSWYVNNYQNGIYQTTDAKAGNYALELQTTLGDHNGTPWPNSAQAGTGYYPNCGGPCTELGGYPFSNQIDTLAFYYKYSPSSTDSASVNINFKHLGTQIWSVGKNLGAAATYQYVEIPVNIPSVPDTVMVNIQSSLWQDSTINFVGSDLKIDEMHFKSHPLSTGISEHTNSDVVTVYPNPFTSTATIELASPEPGTFFELYDVLGKRVMMEQITKQKTIIDRNGLHSGIYFYQIMNDKKTVGNGKLVIQ